MTRPFLILVAWAVACAGCSTHGNRLAEVQAAYFYGGPEHALARIDHHIQKYPREADVLQLDRAIVLLGMGRFKEAEQALQSVRDRFDHLEQKDLAEGAVAMLTDDQRLAYAGEDYEKVLLRAFLALSDLMDDGDDAGAYALQVTAKQQELIEKGTQPDDKNPKQGYQPVAVGPYIQALVREATHANYDDAARSLQLVSHWEPQFPFAEQDLKRVKEGRHSAPGNGVVYVFGLVGRGPYKEEKLEIPTTVALLVADRILSMAGKHSLPPMVAPIKVPRVVVPHNTVQTIRVIADGKDCGRTATITDVGKLALQQDEVMAPYVLGRAIARRAVKKAILYGVKEAADVEKGLLSLGLDAVGVVWEATEAADTRCWGLLPEKIQVLRLELPSGRHTLTLQPATESGSGYGAAETLSVEVEDGRNTFVLANFPGEQMRGWVVSSCDRVSD